MLKSVLVVSGVVASVVAAVFPNSTVDGLPISPHPRDHTQDETPTVEASDIYVLDAVEVGNTFYIPVIVIPDEAFEGIGSGITGSAKPYGVSSLSKVINSTAVPTGGAGFTYSATHETGPRYANATKPADISTKTGTSKVTPSTNRLSVPSLGLDGSASSESNGWDNLPGTSTSAGSYSLSKPSGLPSSYNSPKSPPFLSQSTPGPWNPFAYLGSSGSDKIKVGTLAATFLLITIAVIVLL